MEYSSCVYLFRNLLNSMQAKSLTKDLLEREVRYLIKINFQLSRNIPQGQHSSVNSFRFFEKEKFNINLLCLGLKIIL